MAEYRFTDYFDREVLRKRPYLRREWCIAIIEHPTRVESQENVATDSGVPGPLSAAATYGS